MSPGVWRDRHGFPLESSRGLVDDQTVAGGQQLDVAGYRERRIASLHGESWPIHNTKQIQHQTSNILNLFWRNQETSASLLTSHCEQIV